MSKEQIRKEFGGRLFALMCSKGITQKELAKAVGVTAATLSSYKNGTKSPTLPVAVELAKVLGVSLDWLCGWNTESKPITYSDVIQLLTKLDGGVNIIISDTKGTPCIRFDDIALNHFLTEWKEVRNLLLMGKPTVGKNVYDAWVSQQLEKAQLRSGEEGGDDEMTKSKTIARLEALRNYLSTEENYGAQENDIAALNTVIKAAHSGKRYTAFDIIDMVQHAVSDEICGMGAEDAAIGCEIERGIVAKLVENERNTED